MKQTKNLEDFWSIKIETKKYGELYFSRITEKLSEIFSKVEKEPEQLIEILIDASFYSDRNKNILKENFDITLLSLEEKEQFLQEFLPLQFEGYKYIPDISYYANFEKALEHWKEKIKKQQKELLESIQKSQFNLTNAFGANSFEKLGQLFSNPLHDLQDKINESLRPFDSVYKTIEEVTKLPTISSYTENYYPNLSNALKGINDSIGPLIARINEPIKSLSDQMLEASKALSFPIEQYKSAMDLIPDYYSISKISRDENDNINLYVQNPQDSDEIEYNIKNAEADEGFIKFLHEIPKAEVLKFVTHLQEYPYLALNNETGRKIYDAIQTEIFNYVKVEKDKTFYRARAKNQGAPDWTPLQMGETQYGFPKMERFSFIGKPVFYVASEIETAKLEVQSEKEPESTVMKLQQMKEMTVFDITTEDCPLVSYCNMDKKNDNDYTAYLIPNFLSVCCSYLNKQKRHSVDAIKYKSNKNANGYCYVILDKSPLEFFDDGEIV